jgi:hypothetical protein
VLSLTGAGELLLFETADPAQRITAPFPDLSGSTIGRPGQRADVQRWAPSGNAGIMLIDTGGFSNVAVLGGVIVGELSGKRLLPESRCFRVTRP